MRRIAVSLLVAGLLMTAVPAYTQDVEFDAGVKLWYAEPDVNDRAFMFGPAGSIRFMDTFWITAHYLWGEFEFIESRDPRRVESFDVEDAEIVGGADWDIFRFGAGFRWSTLVISDRSGPDASVLSHPDAYGPMILIGAYQSFAEWPWGFTGSPWGWYADGSWMFHDMGDRDGEHVTIEAGLRHSTYGIRSQLGYRYSYYIDHDKLEGFVASLALEF